MLLALLSVMDRCSDLFDASDAFALGAGKSPMFGDYEAQRHWQEVTYNLPLQKWSVKGGCVYYS